MRFIKTILKLFVMSFLSATVIAGTPDLKPAHGLYMSLSAGGAIGPSYVTTLDGAFGVTNTSGTLVDIWSMSSNAQWAGSAALGYFTGKHFEVEINYIYWGSESLLSYNDEFTFVGNFSGLFRNQTIGLVGIGLIPFNDQLNFLIKLGGGIGFAKLVIYDPQDTIFFTTIVGTYVLNKTYFALTYGAGIQYAFSHHLYGKVEWTQLTATNRDTIDNIGAMMMSVGILYLFAM